MGWVKRFLSAPAFEGDEDKTYTAGLINGILLVALASTTLFLIVSAAGGLGESRALGILVTGLVIVTLLALKILLHRGHIRLVGVLLSLTIWVGFTIPVFVFDGIRDTALTGYFVVIAMASLILGGRTLLVFALLCFATVIAAFFAERYGIIVTSLGVESQMVDLIMVLLTLGSTALLSGVTVRRMVAGYQRARRNEQALRRERDRAQMYLDVAQVVLVALDRIGNVTLINQKGCQVLEWEEEELIGKNWFDTCLPVEIREGVKAVFQRLMTGEIEPTEYYENPVLTKSGEERIVAWRNTVLTNEAGNIVGSLASGEDVTEQRQAEAEVTRLATLVEQATETIIVTDLDGNIIYANPSFETVSGYTVAEAFGQNPRFLKSGHQDKAFYKELWDTITSGETWVGTFVNKRKDGSLYHEEATIFPVRDAEGRIVNYGAVKRDVTERKAREEEYGELVNGMNDTVFVIDFDGNFVKVNDVAAKSLGYSTEELLSMGPQDIDPLKDAEEIGRLIEGMKAGERQVFETQHKTKGGEIIPVEVSSSLVTYRGSRAILSIARDITERKKAEEMLRQQTAELQALAQVSSALRSAGTVQEMLPIVLEEVVRVIGATFDCIFLVEPESDDLVSRASYPTGLYPLGVRHRLGEGITGHVAATGKIHITDDLKHDPLIHIVPEEADALGTVRALLSLPLRAEERVIGVMHISLPEGHLFSPGEIRLGQSIADIAANAIQRAMVVEGLEDEVAARTAEIRAEQEKTETILRSVGDAIIMSDVEMRLRYVNDAFTTLTGYTAQEVLGQPIGMLMRDAMPDQARQAMQLALAQDGSWRGETPGRRKDGRTYDAALVVAPVYDVEGHLEGYVSSHRDISRAKALERARSQFITNVSHELRTPVTTIQLYAHLLQNEAMSETARRYLQAIGVETASLIRLVEDLIVMTVLDSGQILDVWKPVPLPAVIESIVTLYEDEARKADVALEVALLPPGLPAVDGDRARLAQALGELVENGITFTLAGGRVAVAVETVAGEDGDWITITVQDTGPGISPEEQDLVFDRFFRGKLAESGHVPGTGLGLSIAQEIARAHGGRVTVESELGKGSTFTLWLRPSVPDSV